MNIAYPWVFLLPLLFLFIPFVRKWRQLKRPYCGSSTELKKLPVSWRVRLGRPLLSLLLFIAILSMTVAASRPQRLLNLEENAERRNLILALDMSRSMDSKDFVSGMTRVSRAEAVKSVVAEFIEKREGDRLGVVVFGNRAFLQVPLTKDHMLAGDMVRALRTGMAGDGTAIGDGIGLSLKRLVEIDGESKAIVLLTDGVHNSGKVKPLKAAEFADDLGIKIHTIGIGSTRSGGGFFGQRRGPEYDEQTLRQIAETTGGVFFNAEDLSGLRMVYDEIDELERSVTEEPEQQVAQELYLIAAGIAAVAYLLYLTLGFTLFYRVA